MPHLEPSRRRCAQDEEAVETFVALLRACTKSKDLYRGTKLHDAILRKGLLAKCSDALVTMYAKCGALVKAKELFDMHESKDVLTWTALIGGYVQKGHGEDALNCFQRMQHEGLFPDAVTYSCILKACGSIRAAYMGEKIHDEITKEGLLCSDVVLGTALVDMYAKCGFLAKAWRVLEELPVCSVISWNALISGYAEHGEADEAMECFERMQLKGHRPDAVTFLCMLKACGSRRAAHKGGEIHREVSKQGLLRNNPALGTALVDMYAKCGALGKARGVFEDLFTQSVASWNALISGFVEHGEAVQALQFFEWMQGDGLFPNEVTYSCILKACGSTRAACMGEKIHDEIAKQGLLSHNIVLGSAVVDMYAKCGTLAKARRVLEELSFRNVIAWTSLIAGYAEHGEGQEALNCYEQMKSEGILANAVTFVCLLKACGSIKTRDTGEKLHDEVVKQGLLGDDIMLGTALVDMYAKCGVLAKARRVLEELPVRNVISWNALIAGYAEHGDGEQALDCYEQMRGDGIPADAVTFISILKACGSTGAIEKGEEVHDVIAKVGLLKSNSYLGNALVDMYAKCGALVKAHQVLEEVPVRDVICWTALIAGYSDHGEGDRALACFKKMQEEGLSPDAATFSCVLSVCSCLGRVEDALSHFSSMSTKYGVLPDLDHYTCLIDLLGRAGHLDKAVRMLEKMPSASSEIWSALLSACRKWEDVVVGRWAFEHAVKLDQSDGSFYVLMADIYAAAGMQKDAAEIEALRIENQAWKNPVGTSPFCNG